MNEDVLPKIGTMYNSFTKAEKKVADFVQIHSDELVHTSISELADKCGVAETTVFRFCKTLKYRGYSDFRMAMVQSMAEQAADGRVRHNSLVLNGQIQLMDSQSEVVDKVLAANVASMNETRSLLRLDELDRVVNMMVEAEKILLVGAGTSLLTAMDAYNRFVRVTPKVHCVSDPHLQVCVAALLSGPKDLMIAVSYSGQTKDTVECARVAKEVGARVVVVTRFQKSPITSYADVRLLTGSIEGPLQGSSNTVKVAQLYLFDILYVEYLRRTYEESLLNKEKTTKAIMEKLY